MSLIGVLSLIPSALAVSTMLQKETEQCHRNGNVDNVYSQVRVQASQLAIHIRTLGLGTCISFSKPYIPPKAVSWIRVKEPKSTLKASDLLEPVDVKKLIAATPDLRLKRPGNCN